jgi:2-desacetyl-2-hydroxyethyl bacteriochlorophyllide A dehydrogenase
MLAVQKTTPTFGLAINEVAEPERPGPGQVLLAVEAAGICGSDVHVYEWTPGYESLTNAMPVTLGHEFAGRIVAVGSGVDFPAVGDRVTAMPSQGCGRCGPCRAGHEEFCEARSAVGTGRDGAFAPFVLVSARQCFPLPPGLDFEIAALTEPMCVGAQAVVVGEVKLGDIVVVLGAGMIGLAIALMARRAGAAIVVLVGKGDDRRLACASALGFTHLVDLDRVTLAEGLASIVDEKADVVFEATGAPSSIADGLSALRRGGILVTAGIHPRPVEIALTSFVRSKHQLRGSHSAARDIWPAVIRLLAADSESYRPLISHRLRIADALEGFELSRKREAVKAILLPQAA